MIQHITLVVQNSLNKMTQYIYCIFVYPVVRGKFISFMKVTIEMAFYYVRKYQITNRSSTIY